jgi:hypothetical protein
MRYLYLVDMKSVVVKKSRAFRTPDSVTLFDRQMAEEMGHQWLTEEEALSINLMISNDSGHFGIITPARTLEVTVKVEDNAIWAWWLEKWYAVREYRVKGKRPSKMVMREFERTFRLNSGIPVNFDLKFIF